MARGFRLISFQAFIVGLINCNYAFACLDCAAHLSEEVHHPEKMIPIAILGTVAIGFVTSWTFSIALFFSMTNVKDLGTSATGVPLLALFQQALTSKAGAIVLEALVIATGIGCLIACHTWQSRLCWSFARDRGIPFSSFFAKVDHPMNVPVRAHFMSCLIVALVGCLYLGSYTAFARYVLPPEFLFLGCHSCHLVSRRIVSWLEKPRRVLSSMIANGFTSSGGNFPFRYRPR